MNSIKKLTIFAISLLFVSCNKSIDLFETSPTASNLSVTEKLEALGFNLSVGFSENEQGYIVENDILFTEDDINYHYSEYLKNDKLLFNVNNTGRSSATDTLLRASDARAQYRTRELISYSPTTLQTLSIYLEPSLEQAMGNALAQSINRYNQLPILLRFVRTYDSQNAAITIKPIRSQTYIMAAGFPRNGRPYNEIFVNTDYFGNSHQRADAISTLAHEIGHCIGLRHTDYMNRAFSNCFQIGNEGDQGVGAIHIPGTPTQPEANSFMLACSNGLDRPFTQFDRIAIHHLYQQPISFRSDRLNEVEEYYDPFYGDRTVSYDFVVNLFSDAQFIRRTSTLLPMRVRLRYAIGTAVGLNRMEWRNMTSERLVPGNSASINWFRVTDVESYDYGQITHGTQLFQYQGIDILP